MLNKYFDNIDINESYIRRQPQGTACSLDITKELTKIYVLFLEPTTFFNYPLLLTCCYFLKI